MNMCNFDERDLNLANVIPPKSILISQPVLQKIVANYFILNFINKKFVEICFLSCYVSTYIISSVWCLDPLSLKYYLVLYRKHLLTLL